MKTFIIILLITISAIGSNAQKLTPSVFATGGNSYTGKKVAFSYTIGELFVPTVRNSRVLTQGFQQTTKVFTTKINKDNGTKVNVSVFPNPTVDVVNVSIYDVKNFEQNKVEVYDIIGKMFNVPINQSSENNSIKISIDLTNLYAGQYLIRISPLNNAAKIVTFKAIKN